MYNDRNSQAVTIQVSAIDGIQMPQSPMPTQPMAQAPAAAQGSPMPAEVPQGAQELSQRGKTAFVAALEAVRQYHMAKDPAEKEKWKAAAENLHQIVLSDGPQFMSSKVEYTALMANDPSSGMGGKTPGPKGNGPKVSVPPVKPVEYPSRKNQPPMEGKLVRAFDRNAPKQPKPTAPPEAQGTPNPQTPVVAAPQAGQAPKAPAPNAGKQNENKGADQPIAKNNPDVIPKTPLPNQQGNQSGSPEVPASPASNALMTPASEGVMAKGKLPFGEKPDANVDQDSVDTSSVIRVNEAMNNGAFDGPAASQTIAAASKQPIGERGIKKMADLLKTDKVQVDSFLKGALNSARPAPQPPEGKSPAVTQQVPDAEKPIQEAPDANAQQPGTTTPASQAPEDDNGFDGPVPSYMRENAEANSKRFSQQTIDKIGDMHAEGKTAKEIAKELDIMDEFGVPDSQSIRDVRMAHNMPDSGRASGGIAIPEFGADAKQAEKFKKWAEERKKSKGSAPAPGQAKPAMTDDQPDAETKRLKAESAKDRADLDAEKNKGVPVNETPQGEKPAAGETGSPDDIKKASADFNDEINKTAKANSTVEVDGAKGTPKPTAPKSKSDAALDPVNKAFEEGTKAKGIDTAQTALNVLHHLVGSARSFVGGRYAEGVGGLANAAATREGFRSDQKVLQARQEEAKGETDRWGRIVKKMNGEMVGPDGKDVGLTTTEAVAARRAFKRYDLKVKKAIAAALNIPNAKNLTSDELNVEVDNFFNKNSPDSQDAAERHDQMLQQNQKFVDTMDSGGTLTPAEVRGFKNDLHALTHPELKSLAESQGLNPMGSRKLLINQLKSKIDSHEEGRMAREKAKAGSKELLDEQVDALKLAYDPQTGEYVPEAPITDKAVATSMANTFSKLTDEEKIATLKKMVENPDEIDQIKGTGLNTKFREELDKHTLKSKTRGQELQGEDNLDVADRIKNKLEDPEAEGLSQEDLKSFVQSLPKDEQELRTLGVAMGINDKDANGKDIPIQRLRVRIRDMAASALQKEADPLENGENEDSGDIDALAEHLASDEDNVLTKTNAAIMKKAIPKGDTEALREMSEKMNLNTVNPLNGKPYGPLALEENIKEEIAKRTEKPEKAIKAPKAPPKGEGNEGGGPTPPPETPPTPPAPPVASAEEANSTKGDKAPSILGGNPKEFVDGGGMTFKTAQGSHYAYRDGKTVRIKSPHMGHDKNDHGLKEQSEQTYFIDPKDAERIGMWQTSNATNKRIVIKDGHAILTSKVYDAPQGKDGEKIKLSDKPEIGKAPLELWGKSSQGEGVWRNNHPGNPITEMTDPEKSHAEFTGKSSPTQEAQPVVPENELPFDPPQAAPEIPKPASGSSAKPPENTGEPIAQPEEGRKAIREKLAAAGVKVDGKDEDALGSEDDIQDRLADLHWDIVEKVDAAKKSITEGGSPLIGSLEGVGEIEGRINLLLKAQEALKKPSGVIAVEGKPTVNTARVQEEPNASIPEPPVGRKSRGKGDAFVPPADFDPKQLIGMPKGMTDEGPRELPEKKAEEDPLLNEEWSKRQMPGGDLAQKPGESDKDHQTRVEQALGNLGEKTASNRVPNDPGTPEPPAYKPEKPKKDKRGPITTIRNIAEGMNETGDFSGFIRADKAPDIVKAYFDKVMPDGPDKRVRDARYAAWARVINKTAAINAAFSRGAQPEAIEEFLDDITDNMRKGKEDVLEGTLAAIGMANRQKAVDESAKPENRQTGKPLASEEVRATKAFKDVDPIDHEFLGSRDQINKKIQELTSMASTIERLSRNGEDDEQPMPEELADLPNLQRRAKALMALHRELGEKKNPPQDGGDQGGGSAPSKTPPNKPSPPSPAKTESEIVSQKFKDRNAATPAPKPKVTPQVSWDDVKPGSELSEAEVKEKMDGMRSHPAVVHRYEDKESGTEAFVTKGKGKLAGQYGVNLVDAETGESVGPITFHPTLKRANAAAMKATNQTSNRALLAQEKQKEIEEIRELARSEGHDPKALDEFLPEIKKVHNARVEAYNTMLKEARESLQLMANDGQKFSGAKTKGVPNAKKIADDGGDWTRIKGIDRVAEELAGVYDGNGPYSEFFKKPTGETGSYEDQLFEMLEGGNMKPMSDVEAYKEALNRMMSFGPPSGDTTGEEVAASLSRDDDEAWRDIPSEGGDLSFDVGEFEGGEEEEPFDSSAVANKLKTGGTVTPEEAKGARDAYAKMSGAEKVAFAKALGLSKAGSALDSTRDDLVEQEIVNGEFRKSREDKGIDPELQEGGTLFREPGIGESNGLFDEVGEGDSKPAEVERPTETDESKKVSEGLKARAARKNIEDAANEFLDDPKNVGVPGVRYDLLYEAAKKKMPDLTEDQFRGVMEDMREDRGNWTMGGWAKTKHEIHNPKLAIPREKGNENPGSNVQYYVQRPASRQYDAPKPQSAPKPETKPTPVVKKKEPEVNSRANDGIDDKLITEVKAAQVRRRDANFMGKKEAESLGEKLATLNEEQLKKFLKAHGMAPFGQDKMTKADIIDSLVSGWYGKPKKKTEDDD